MKFAPKLTALFISIGAIVAAIMYTIAYFQVAKILEGEIRVRMESRVIFTMDALDRFLSRSLNDIKIIAGDPVISSGNATAEEITERLIFFRNTYKWYASLSFFNLERIRIADTASMKIGEQNRMTRYWEDVLAGQISAASDVHISEDLKVPVVYFASAVTNKEGKVVGVVVTRILKNRLFEMVKGSTGSQEEEEEIDIVNKDGLLIYSNHNREGILRDNLSEWESVKMAHQGEVMGSAKHRHPGEEETIYTFCRERGYLDFKGNGWTIISHIPTRVIFISINKLVKILIIMFLVMLTGLALVIYLFSKTVTRPLTRLSFAVAEIGKGKLDTVIEVKSKDEFGSLANTFNQMGADLKKTTTSIDDLNKEIAERKRIEEALRETSGYLQNLITYANAPIIVWDLYFRITQFNRAFESLTGRKASDVIGKPLELLFPTAMVENTMKLIRNTLTGERWEVVEINIQHIDGSVRTVLWNSATIFAPDGKTPEAIIAQGQDITERKHAEEALKESKERLELALSAASMGTWRWNIKTDQDTRDANFNSMLGLKAAESTQSVKDFIQYVHPDDRAVVDEEIKRAIRERDIYRIEFRIVRPDGTIYWFSDRGKIYYDQKNEPAYMTGAVFNITKRKRAEEEREKLIQELQKALAEVKTLSGLIPICASCKKIRDDKGYWGQIESYISDHSEAEFSHGICPDCMKKLYPDIEI